MSSAPEPVAGAVRDRLVQQKARLQSLRDQARQRYAGGAPGLQVAALICGMTDGLVRELFEEVLKPLSAPTREAVMRQTAIVAVGGTGRGELAPYSDVDLLFLHTPRCDDALFECVSQAVRDCWDAGLKLAHSVRTPADALATARLDPQFATALVEARLLWGNERLFHAFQSRFHRQIARNRYADFYREIVAARQAERAQFGETERQLEPDVKRSPGGLRDIHLIRWIGFARYGTTDIDLLRLEGALTRDDAQAVAAAQEFITRIRVDLHFAAGKAQEVLTREEQLRLAELHGVSPVPGQRPVERFMQTYFRHSSAVAGIASRFAVRHRPGSWLARIAKFLLSHRSNRIFRVSSGEIDVVPRFRERACGTLEALLNLYELAGLYSVRPSPELVEQIRQAVPKIPRTVSPEAARLFLSVLRPGGQAGRLLREMYGTGLLEIILPEMTHARCLLQFNQYHSYTVDEHSLRAVEAAERFESDAGPVGIAYRQIRHREILHLALLLHDLGKGYEADHSEVGREIARAVAERLGLSRHLGEMLEFLVHKHLLMAHLAFRRDLSDVEMLMRFSRDVGSPELLRMLFALTAADMTAVGPGTWTNWKAELTAELFDRAMQVLAGAPPKFREAERIREIADRVFSLLDGAQPADAGRAPGGPAASAEPAGAGAISRRDDDFDSLPLHYLTATAPEQIARDLVAIRRLAAEELVISGTYEPPTNTVEYRVITRDTIGSGLFSRITGALTAKGLEILSANICTSAAGVVIDSFRVHDGDHFGIVPEFRLRDVEAAIADVLAGRTTVEHLFQRHRRLRRDETPKLFREPTRVVIDNDSTERFTIIDVFAHDRRGLLYTIAAVLLEMGLSVSLAKISTHLDQVLDVFYVTDREGGKLQDESRLKEIQDVLTARIEEFERRGFVAHAAG
ncbi:MAG: bifunctional uridylyltransferase/uridylyl-removing protein GlnD [Deltaproteobacteria bacterium]